MTDLIPIDGNRFIATLGDFAAKRIGDLKPDQQEKVFCLLAGELMNIYPGMTPDEIWPHLENDPEMLEWMKVQTSHFCHKVRKDEAKRLENKAVSRKLLGSSAMTQLPGRPT